MAKINKLQKSGVTIYPATIPQAVIDSETGKTQKEVNDDVVEVAKTLKQVDDDALMRLTNLITNGNFVNGTTGWTFNSNISGASASSGVLSFTGGGALNASTNNWVRRASVTMFPQGNVLYNMVTARSLMEARFYVGIGYSFSTFDLTDEWGTYSHLGSSGSTNYPTYAATSNITVEMTNAMCFDLTEIFGAGNEPTKEEMDLLISTLGTDYFEGEITITAQMLIGWQLAMIRQKRNAIIALGGTII